MNSAIAEICSLLLDLIGPARAITQRRVDAIGDRGWASLLAAAEQHRLLPILHWNVSGRLRDLTLPPGIRERCAAAYRVSTLLALSQQRDLLLIHRRLSAAGIAHVAMKGAYLAHHAYPEPGLRPLRDLDILVPADRAIEAYELLRASRVDTAHSGSSADPALVKAIAHHLPSFQLAGRRTNVEIHHKIFANEAVDSPVAGRNSARRMGNDPACDPSFWERCIVRDLAGAPISYMAPTDLLRHVIVHAVYAHEFNNGPLFLADIAWLLESHAIDWSLFWRLVATHERGAALALRMMETYWGPRRIDWSAAPSVCGDIPEAVAEAAAQLSLRELDSSPLLKSLQDLRDRRGLGTKARVGWRRLFPDQEALAATYAPAGTRPWLATLYFRRSRILIRRLFSAYRAVARSRTMGQDLDALARVRDWLGGQTSATATLPEALPRH